jgi:hypothetical protein
MKKNLKVKIKLNLGCTFTPELNKNSELIDKRNNGNILKYLNDESLNYFKEKNLLIFKD